MKPRNSSRRSDRATPKATVAFGLSRPDLRDEFLEFLKAITQNETGLPAKVAARA